jgi:dihydrofolate reductase
VYRELEPWADAVEQTVLDLDVPGDAFAPELLPEHWVPADGDPPVGWHTSSAGPRYRFVRWLRVPGTGAPPA